MSILVDLLGFFLFVFSFVGLAFLFIGPLAQYVVLIIALCNGELTKSELKKYIFPYWGIIKFLKVKYDSLDK